MRDPKGAPSDFNIDTYTRTRECQARDIAVPVNVNGEASEILGCSYCNVSRRLLKSAGKKRREMGSVFLPRDRVGRGEFHRGSPIETTSPTGEVIGCVSS